MQISLSTPITLQAHRQTEKELKTPGLRHPVVGKKEQQANNTRHFDKNMYFIKLSGLKDYSVREKMLKQKKNNT